MAKNLLLALVIMFYFTQTHSISASRSKLYGKVISKKVIRWQQSEHRHFGLKKHKKLYARKKYKNTKVMQRSGRKRLYDHNIFLRALYRDKIVHKKDGSLNRLMKDAMFIDIGSAILMGKGAPTVRDIDEDEDVKKHLSMILATDINEGSKSTHYVDKFFKSGKTLPFAVREIPLVLDSEEKWRKLLFGIDVGQPVILRCTNSGPDLFYSKKSIIKHFKSIVSYFSDRSVLYIFNKYLLYKPIDKSRFYKIGTFDPRVSISHYKARWRKINWKKRKLRRALKLNKKYMVLKKSSKRRKKKKRRKRRRKRRRRR